MKRVVCNTSERVDPNKLDYKPFKQREEYELMRASGDDANRTMKVLQVSHKRMMMEVAIIGSELESFKVYKTFVCSIKHQDGSDHETATFPYDLRMYLNVQSTDNQVK